MKKAMTVYVWLQVILTVFGAVWALTKPESYGEYLAAVTKPMMKSFGLIGDDEK